ncbi:MAG: SMC family ATPase, partial [Aigarchaeota archaeon]|nr:SMC family ATPase [Aigarchaeota archaeon]
MITRIRLVNFACHKDTEIKFSDGLTIFLGRNGSGKSSVIDAMTYALYGRHTRGSRENIVRDGSGGGVVELEFDFRGERYKVVRSFNARGELENAALMKNNSPLVIGERRRDEAVSVRVEKLLGLSYERMRTAVIIHQGELDRILSAEPRELKELFDDLMGFTAMEKAYQTMYDVIKDFENRIIKQTGRPIQEADKIDEEIARLERDLMTHEEKKSRIYGEISDLERELNEVEERLKELSGAKKLEEKFKLGLEKLRGILNEKLQQLRNALENAAKYLEVLELRDEIEKRVERVNELDARIQQIEKSLGSLEGRKEEILRTLRELEEQALGIEVTASRAKSLGELLTEARSRAEKLRDDAIELGRLMASRGGQGSLLRLQVDQEVEELVNVVSEAYNSALMSYAAELIKRRRQLEEELDNVRNEISSLQSKLREVRREREELSKLKGEDVLELRGMVKSAEKELERLGGASGVASITTIYKQLQDKASSLEKAISGGVLPSESLLEDLSAFLDKEELEFLNELREMSVALREKRYDPEELTVLERERNDFTKKIAEKRGLLDVIESEIKRIGEQLEVLRRIKGELLEAKKFYELLEKIRNELYYRDGAVLRGLRAWILGKVADHARKYLDIFETRIDDVKIEESAKAINFKCYYRGREVDVKRLSGGEKVALALAIRLAIGD